MSDVSLAPPAASEAEFVADGSVGNNTFAPRVSRKLGNQGPAAFLSGFVEKVLEGALESQFVDDTLIFKVLQILQICLDDRIVASKFEHRTTIVTALSASISGFGLQRLIVRATVGHG